MACEILTFLSVIFLSYCAAADFTWPTSTNNFQPTTFQQSPTSTQSGFFGSPQSVQTPSGPLVRQNIGQHLQPAQQSQFRCKYNDELNHIIFSVYQHYLFLKFQFNRNGLQSLVVVTVAMETMAEVTDANRMKTVFLQDVLQLNVPKDVLDLCEYVL